MNVFRYAALVLFSAACVAQQAPALSYVRSLAGSASHTVAGIATDRVGNVYVAGTTLSPDFPVKDGLQSQMGSSTLFQIDPAAGFRKLPPAIASDILALAADPRNSSVPVCGHSEGAIQDDRRGCHMAGHWRFAERWRDLIGG